MGCHFGASSFRRFNGSYVFDLSESPPAVGNRFVIRCIELIKLNAASTTSTADLVTQHGKGTRQ